MKAPLEQDILRQCLQWLHWQQDMVCWRNNTGAAVLTGKGNKPRYVKFGMPGSSDILGFMKPGGVFVGIEVKRPGNRPTPEQAAFLAQLKLFGGLAAVVHSIDELIETVNAWRKARGL